MRGPANQWLFTGTLYLVTATSTMDMVEKQLTSNHKKYMSPVHQTRIQITWAAERLHSACYCFHFWQHPCLLFCSLCRSSAWFTVYIMQSERQLKVVGAGWHWPATDLPISPRPISKWAPVATHQCLPSNKCSRHFELEGTDFDLPVATNYAFCHLNHKIMFTIVKKVYKKVSNFFYMKWLIDMKHKKFATKISTKSTNSEWFIKLVGKIQFQSSEWFKTEKQNWYSFIHCRSNYKQLTNICMQQDQAMKRIYVNSQMLCNLWHCHYCNE